ncbi:MAG: MATE family efflux transporter [Lachnospiraceae bacterium]|nr:MATE family efflux transporter [Lachnospiraceae bacterium]
MDSRTITTEQKPVIREILNIGIPSFLETLFTTFAGIIDSKMVSALGVTAISAVSVTNQPRLFIFSVFFALNTVTSSLVAKYFGKKDRETANRIFDHVMKLVLILSALLSILAVVLARPIMIAFANQKDTMEHSIIYFRIVMGGMIFNLVFMTINSALRGCGLTKLTFVSNVVSCLVNILCNYLLIEGHLGFPRLEYAGAAIATVTGNFAAMIMTLVFANKKDLFVNIPYCLKQKYRMTKESLTEITQLAKSCVTDSLAMRLSLLFISGIVARIGSYQMAVYSVGMHLLNVNFALGTGLQTAGVALIGRSYGAEDKKMMKTYKNSLLRIGNITAVALALVIIAGGRWFFGFFSEDEKFIEMGTISCCIIGIITLAQTLKFVYSGYLQGIGAMKQVMVASIVAFAGVNLTTLAVFVLVLHSGIWGVWISSLLSQSVQAIILYIYVRKAEV